MNLPRANTRISKFEGRLLMSLLTELVGAMTAQAPVNDLSNKVGGSNAQISSLISAALPLLMQSKTNNASSPAGAASLLSALAQHTNTAPVAQQISNADLIDGGKIIGHILGNNSASVMNSLAQQSGLNTNQVSSVLGSIAPALMSSMSAATLQKPKQKKPGVDLSVGLDLKDIIGIYSALNSAKPQQQTQNAANPLLGLLGSFLG